jgi:hypothetical protein
MNTKNLPPGTLSWLKDIFPLRGAVGPDVDIAVHLGGERPSFNCYPNHGSMTNPLPVVAARGAKQKRLLVGRDAGGVDIGVQRLGERVMARHHVLLTAFLVQPDQPARAFRLQVLHAHLERRPDAGEAVGEAPYCFAVHRIVEIRVFGSGTLRRPVHGALRFAAGAEAFMRWRSLAFGWGWVGFREGWPSLLGGCNGASGPLPSNM